MAYQQSFKRYELKYLITVPQKEKLLKVLEPYMKLDEYGKSEIRNIYFDNDSFRLIRNSIDKPLYKEKLRVRSYGRPKEDEPVFVEIKKKYNHIVYKRRIKMPEIAAKEILKSNDNLPQDTQISREIDYFRKLYGPLTPKVFLCYDREAYYTIEPSDFRITFDDNIKYRLDNLELNSDSSGTKILPDDKVLMEVKTSTSIPLWLAHFLSEEHIYKTSFSKYGTAYGGFYNV